MISKNFARCLAKISGDGNLYYRYVRYSNTCDTLLKEFKDDMIEEFGKIKFSEGVSNSGTKFVQVHGKHIIGRFLQHLKSFKSDALYIPNSIKNAAKSIKSEYLKAFYDDESCAAIRLYSKNKEWKRNITLASNSFRLLNDIKEMLINDFNIKSNEIIRSRRDSIRDKTHILSITGKNNIISFQKLLCFKHPKKSFKLKIMIESYNCTSKNKEKFENLKMRLSNPI